jgi:hypothetical protein
MMDYKFEGFQKMEVFYPVIGCGAWNHKQSKNVSHGKTSLRLQKLLEAICSFKLSALQPP